MRYLVAVTALIFIVALFMSQRPESPSYAAPMTAAQGQAIATAIKGRGFNCPEAKLAYNEGQDAYGGVLRVFCGPAGGNGVYSNASFRITSLQNGWLMVQPWK